MIYDHYSLSIYRTSSITVQLSLQSIDLPAILGGDVFNTVRVSLQSVNIAVNFISVQLALQSASLLSIHLPCIFIHIYDCFVFINVSLWLHHNFLFEYWGVKCLDICDSVLSHCCQYSNDVTFLGIFDTICVRVASKILLGHIAIVVDFQVLWIFQHMSY